jgi:hypothetical protein
MYIGRQGLHLRLLCIFITHIAINSESASRLCFSQVIVGDLLSQRDVQRAVQGVDYIYFSFAVQQGLMEASTIAAVAAAEAGEVLLLYQRRPTRIQAWTL